MSRLYPGWGSGKKPFEGQFHAYSHAAQGQTESEGGDKAILPQSAFKEVSRLRLPFPLVFEVKNPKRKQHLPATNRKNAMQRSRGRGHGQSQGPGKGRDRAHKQAVPPIRNALQAKGNREKGRNREETREVMRQMCGVIEFSAPDGQVYLPSWMMKNLSVREGGLVNLKSVLTSSLPKGTFCKLQPHSSDFLELAASMNLRDLLESSFRNYSVLTAGETIMVRFAGGSYYLNVVETAPEKAISLYGSLDLEVDFMAPLDTALGKIRPTTADRPRSGESSRESQQAAAEEEQANDTPHEQQAATTGEGPTESHQQNPDEGESLQQPEKKPAPIAAVDKEDKETQEKTHNWGSGRSLLTGDSTAPELQESSGPASSESNTGKTTCSTSGSGQLPKRMPTYSKKQMSSFCGNGNVLSESSNGKQPGTIDPKQQLDNTDDAPRPDAAAIRRQRLAFFDRLRNQETPK